MPDLVVRLITPPANRPHSAPRLFVCYLELLDRILRGNQCKEVKIVDMHGTTVDMGGALVSLTAADLKISPGKDVGASRVER